jgi:hypothetical protein
MAAMEKVFKCLTCQKEIRLERKPDNSGWPRWSLDGTNHVDVSSKKSKQQRQHSPQAVAADCAPQIADLAKQVSGLKDTVNILIARIESLRSKIKTVK